MILGIDHAQITIPSGSEEIARDFYSNFLGLLEIEKPENRKKNGGFWLVAGSLQLHVGLEDGVDRTKTKAHIAYQVDDLKAWKKKILGKSIDVIESLPFDHAAAFEFRDPFGNRVELIERFK